MRSNALRKEEFDYVGQMQDLISVESWETFRKRVAQQAEEGCNIVGNQNGPDLGEFEEKYLKGSATDFA